MKFRRKEDILEESLQERKCGVKSKKFGRKEFHSEGISTL